jgi:twitching motility protein PilT
MAKIDRFLMQMVEKGGTVVRLYPDEPPVLELPGGHRVPLSRQQIQGAVVDGLVQEIVPEHLAAAYLRGEKISFDYGAVGGHFQCLADRAGQGARFVGARMGQPVADSPGRPMLDRLTPLVYRLLQESGSDLYLNTDQPPALRLGSRVVPLAEYGVLSARRLQELIQNWVPAKVWEAYQAGQDTEFARSGAGLPCRLRVSLLHDFAGPAITVRVIPGGIPDADTLGLSPAARRLAGLNKGLVLLTGPMGSGKTTTQACLLDLASRQRDGYLITVLDSTEFVLAPGRCTVLQREVGCDPARQKQALRAALRQAPDILAVGELRDGEILELALQAVQTGRMVLGILATATLEETLSTLAGYFPQEQRPRILGKLADSLTAILGHALLPKEGGGQVVAMETLFNNPQIAGLIREDKLAQVPQTRLPGRYGQVSHNEALVALIKARAVPPMEAYLRCHDRKSFIAACKKAGIEFDPRDAGQLVTEA